MDEEIYDLSHDDYVERLIRERDAASAENEKLTADLAIERGALEVSVRLTLAAIGLPAPHASERTVKSMMDDCRRNASADSAKEGKGE